VTSFLGGAAISKHGLDVWGVLALGGFVGSIALATWVLLPKEHLIFSVQGSALFEDEIRADVFDPGETHRRLAYWLDEYHALNLPKLDSESDRSRRREVLEEAPVVRDQQHCARVIGERIFKLLDRF
jgi:hypothetical protein